VSTVNVNRVVDTSGGVLAPISSVMRNRIINGAMVIDQRNAGASVSTASGVVGYPVDRFKVDYSQTSKFTMQQNAGSVTPPAGFTNYLGITSSSAYSVLADDFFVITQPIEGFNTADLGWGTANAKTVTLSFWVRSSLTGTFGGSIQNSAANRSYPFTYTISAANTWELETITIAGDTTGTWIGATNGVGLSVALSIGMGSTRSGTAGAWAAGNFVSATGATSVVGTSGATFYITGVQLEVGTQATSFEYRQYGTELNLCQRYCQMIKGTTNFTKYGMGVCTSTTNLRGVIHLPVSMRISPSLTTTSTASNYGVFISSDIACSAVPTLNAQGTEVLANIDFTVASGLTTGNAALMQANNNTSAFLLLTAEL
jgi:hypothetical protein